MSQRPKRSTTPKQAAKAELKDVEETKKNGRKSKSTQKIEVDEATTVEVSTRSSKKKVAVKSKKAEEEQVKEVIVKKVKIDKEEEKAIPQDEKITQDSDTIVTDVVTTEISKVRSKKKGNALITEVVQSIGTIKTETVVTKKPPLERAFYKKDIVQLSKDLLGKYFVREYDGKRIQAKIVETEAYAGKIDKACHAYGGKVTEKNKWMYREGGRLYVYSIYGNNYCLNVTSNEADDPSAVLIRAVEPVEGLEYVKENRKLPKLSKSGKELCNGPGKTGQALKIDKSWNECDLTKEDSGFYISEGDGEPFEMVTSTRINIDYAEEDKDNPWRFYIKGNPFVSVK